MSKFTYDGPLLTRQEFAAGYAGVYRVEGEPITGYKTTYCTNYTMFGKWRKTDSCRVPVSVPVGEYIVAPRQWSYMKAISARASGINVHTTAAVVKSTYDPEYEYWKTKTNYPREECPAGQFFNVQSEVECGMHFTFQTHKA